MADLNENNQNRISFCIQTYMTYYFNRNRWRKSSPTQLWGCPGRSPQRALGTPGVLILPFENQESVISCHKVSVQLPFAKLMKSLEKEITSQSIHIYIQKYNWFVHSFWIRLILYKCRLLCWNEMLMTPTSQLITTKQI